MKRLMNRPRVCGQKFKIKLLAFVSTALLLPAWQLVSGGTSYAAEESSAAKLVEIANERLEAENTELKDEKAKLETEWNKINSERQDILNKLKIITEENTKLKDQITTLQQGLIDLDNVRKQLAEDKRQMTQKLAELQQQAELTVAARPAGEVSKIGKISAKKISELEKEVIRLTNRTRQLEGQLDTQRRKVRFTDRLDKEKKRLQEEVKGLRLAMNSLEEQAKKHSQETTALRVKLKQAAAKVFKSQKNLDKLEKETADMHYNLGVIFQGQNKYDDALREYQKTLEIKPNDTDAHYNLALIYDTVKNDRKKAIYHYNKYLENSINVKDALRIKEKITRLSTEEKIWGEPQAKELNEKKGDW